MEERLKWISFLGSGDKEAAGICSARQSTKEE